MPDGTGKWVEDFTALLGAGGLMHLVDRFFLLRKDRAEAGKTSAEGDATVSSAWREHVEALQHEGEQLRVMVEDLWRKRRECEDAMAAMSAEIIGLKATLAAISRRSDLQHGTTPER